MRLLLFYLFIYLFISILNKLIIHVSHRIKLELDDDEYDDDIYVCIVIVRLYIF